MPQLPVHLKIKSPHSIRNSNTLKKIEKLCFGLLIVRKQKGYLEKERRGEKQPRQWLRVPEAFLSLGETCIQKKLCLKLSLPTSSLPLLLPSNFKAQSKIQNCLIFSKVWDFPVTQMMIVKNFILGWTRSCQAQGREPIIKSHLKRKARTILG